MHKHLTALLVALASTSGFAQTTTIAPLPKPTSSATAAPTLVNAQQTLVTTTVPTPMTAQALPVIKPVVTNQTISLPGIVIPKPRTDR